MRRLPYTQARLLATRDSIFALTLSFVTVGHFTLPIAGLFIKIESQSRRASDLFKTWPSAPVSIKINSLKCCLDFEVIVRKANGYMPFLSFYVITEARPSYDHSSSLAELTFYLIAILNMSFPVTCLTVDIKRQPTGTAYGSKSGDSIFSSLVTPVHSHVVNTSSFVLMYKR